MKKLKILIIYKILINYLKVLKYKINYYNDYKYIYYGFGCGVDFITYLKWNQKYGNKMESYVASFMDCSNLII